MAVLKLNLFGEFELAGTHGRRLQTRKAQALLAFLALSAGRPRRRDKLAALLWGEMEDDKAHHNVAQALHLIRKALDTDGASPLIADSRTVALDPRATNPG